MPYNKSVGRYFVSVPTQMKLPNNPIKVLFVCENYPKDLNEDLDNTYTFRSMIHPSSEFRKNNVLLYNLSEAIGLNAENESELMSKFLERYFVIDTYAHGHNWTKNTPLCGSISAIAQDINELSPEQVIFCYRRSNGKIFEKIIAELNPEIKVIRPMDNEGKVVHNIFLSPTGQWFKDQHYKKGYTKIGFKTQIQLAITQNVLEL